MSYLQCTVTKSTPQDIANLPTPTRNDIQAQQMQPVRSQPPPKQLYIAPAVQYPVINPPKISKYAPLLKPVKIDESKQLSVLQSGMGEPKTKPKKKRINVYLPAEKALQTLEKTQKKKSKKTNKEDCLNKISDSVKDIISKF